MLKPILKITGIVLILIFASVLAAPIFFKGKILSLVKSEINKNVVADVTFSDLDISLLRNFPNLSAGLKGLVITGRDNFSKDTLLSAEKIDIALNLFSVISGKNKIDAIILNKPRIHAIINKEGKANWDITVPDTLYSADESTTSFSMELSRYEIKDGYISYLDIPGNMKAEIINLNHTGKGNFNQDQFLLSTQTRADYINFEYERIPWLVRTKANIDADVQIDNITNTYSFKTGDIKLNELLLASEGFFQIASDSTYKMDIRFSAPSTEFKTLLSLIPAVYQQDFDKIKTSGETIFKGWVKGTYGPSEMPGYHLNLEVKNGMFRYPDLPEPVKDINLVMKVDNPDGITDHTIIDIPTAHISFGNDPFDFRLLFKNPETVRYLDAAAKGKLNLAQVGHFVKLDAGTKMSGTLDADIFAKGNFSGIEKGQGDFTAGGYLYIRELAYASSLFPVPIKNGRMHIDVHNTGGVADETNIRITEGHIDLGTDPVDFTFQLSKPVTEMIFDGSVKGNFPLERIKQFAPLEPGTTISGSLYSDISFSGSKDAVDKKQYEKIDARGHLGIKDLQYVSKDYPGGMRISAADIQFTPQQVNLKSFAGQYLGTNFTASGILHNLIGYAMSNQLLDGSLQVSAGKINLNDWMGTEIETDSTVVSGDAFPVPANINLTLQASADEVKYDKVNYKNVAGTLLVKDETIRLQNIKTEALSGEILFNGSYSTADHASPPGIAMNYAVKNIDIQQAFYAYNTMQKLMPVGKFISGKLSSEMNMTGVLGKDMMPDLSTLTGSGNLLLLEGVLKKFAPVEKLSADLGITELQEISLKDVKNYFQFSNGKMLVKPFNVTMKDIQMQIGGVQGIDQTLDYLVQMKLPRSLMGTKGNDLVNNLISQANAKGIPATVSEVVDLNIRLMGTIMKPQIVIDYKETAAGITDAFKEQATAFAKQKTDSVKLVAVAAGKTLKDTATVLKDRAVQDLKKDLVAKLSGEKDSTQSEVNTFDRTKKTAEQTLKNTFEGLLKKKKRKDSTGR
jgi:AsmA-like C-terminal region/AsmA family